MCHTLLPTCSPGICVCPPNTSTRRGTIRGWVRVELRPLIAFSPKSPMATRTRRLTTPSRKTCLMKRGTLPRVETSTIITTPIRCRVVRNSRNLTSPTNKRAITIKLEKHPSQFMNRLSGTMDVRGEPITLLLLGLSQFICHHRISQIV